MRLLVLLPLLSLSACGVTQWQRDQDKAQALFERARQINAQFSELK